ncbi:MAG: NADH-quinone oxidoreductase subunit M [Gemmatimonadaceae bacterium]|nr:NADH-quinone oxidoreductase subunit M [Gemmatimonadaceae bacterium]
MTDLLLSLGMRAEWLLPALLVLPVIAAIIVWVLPGDARLARPLSLVVLFTVALLATTCWWLVPAAGSAGFTADHPWIEEFGTRLRLTATGVSLPMILLTAWLMPLALLACGPADDAVRPRAFHAQVLLLSAGILGIFLAGDLLVFYLAWELMLVPLYFLIGAWGSARGPRAATTFFIYTLVGSLLMLVAILHVVRMTGTTVLPQVMEALATRPMSLTAQLWCFGAFAAAFLVKSALVPFHTWLPDAQGESPAVAATALGIKVGTYGMLAIAMPLFPAAAMHPVVRLVLMALGVAAILHGSLVALVQPDFRRVMSYASVAHLGFVVVGLAAFTPESVQGALMVMLNAGITTGGMFVVLGILRDRLGANDGFAALGGLARTLPALSSVVVLLVLANVGLPGTNGFVGEFLVLLGAYGPYPYLVLLATIGVILAAAALLWAVQRTLFGPAVERAAPLRDLGTREAVVMGAFVVAILALGLAPAPMLDRTRPQTLRLIETVRATSVDPMSLPLPLGSR